MASGNGESAGQMGAAARHEKPGVAISLALANRSVNALGVIRFPSRNCLRFLRTYLAMHWDYLPQSVSVTEATMRALLTLILGMALFAGVLNGSIVHAVELGAGEEVTAATEWLHGAHDHDEVPADADKDYPHHHNQCHGHDVAAQLKLCAAPVQESARAPLVPMPVAAMDTGPAPRLLRPPIA